MTFKGLSFFGYHHLHLHEPEIPNKICVYPFPLGYAIDEVLRGLLSSSVEVFDHSITSEVTNHLFEDSRVPFSGMDLVSLNIQRGRDHGLASYNEYRALCNRTRAKHFDDLKDDIPEDIVQRLRTVYE